MAGETSFMEQGANTSRKIYFLCVTLIDATAQEHDCEENSEELFTQSDYNFGKAPKTLLRSEFLIGMQSHEYQARKR